MGKHLGRRSLVLLAAVGLSTGLAAAADRLILGNKFQISNPTGSEAKRSVIGVGREKPSDVPTLSNPTTGGATLTVIANGAFSSNESYVLDASGWKASSGGYKYRGPTGPDGDPVRSVILKKSASGSVQLSITIKGNVGTQDVKVFPPAPGDDGGFILDVVGGDRYCVAFGTGGAGGNETRDSVLQWKIVKAGGQPGCPTPATTTTIPSPPTTSSTIPGPSPLCPEDPTREIFAGGPNTSACTQFNGDQASCERAFHIGGSGCGAASCYFDFNSGDCLGCGPNNEQSGRCVNTCVRGAPRCPGDPTRTILAGFANSSACTNLSFSKTLCEKAFHIDGTGHPASCFFDDDTEQCLGCGPNNLEAGRCANTCPRCDSDATRTIYAGDSSGPGCGKFNASPSSCAGAFTLNSDTTAYTSCFFESGSAGGCFACGPAEQSNQDCINTCPTCAHDPARQIFVGGPNTGACNIFSNSPILCNQSFHMGGTCNEISSCFYNVDDGSCQGCGPQNQENGLCGNQCAAPICGDGQVNLPNEQCDGSDIGTCGLNSVCSPDCHCAPCTGNLIPPQGGSFLGSTNGSSMLSTTNCGAGTGISPETIYAWTPNTSGQAVITTCGTSFFDTVLYVREGTCRGPEIGCNDDACGGASLVNATVSAGTTYFIVVDGYGGNRGNFTLTVVPASPSGAFVDGVE